MQQEPLIAGTPAGDTRFFTDANWWLFCLLILVLNFLLLALDPLPKLFMGDSASYLWTALSGWMPPDRSFLYGYVIRWSSLWTESLTSLLILQAFLGAVTAILVRLSAVRFLDLPLVCPIFSAFFVRWIRCNSCGSATL